MQEAGKDYRTRLFFDPLTNTKAGMPCTTKTTIIPYRFPMKQYQRLLKVPPSGLKVFTMKQDSQSGKKLPEGIRLLPNGKYMVSVSRHYVRRSRQALSLKEALTVKSDLLKELEMGIEASPPRKARKLTAAYPMAAKAPHGLWKSHWTAPSRPTGRTGKEAGQTPYNDNARECVRFFGPRTRLDTIDPDWIDDYVDYLSKKGNSGSTINRKLSSLSRMLTTAYERGRLKWLPKMPRRPEGSHRVCFLTIEEERQAIRIIDQLGYSEHGQAFLVLLYTGCRCGELWRLECRDVNLELGTITFWKTKNGHPRTIPIVDTIRPIIEYRMELVGGAGKLFPKGSPEWFRRLWDKLRVQMKREDDPQFVPHMLRHTCATRLAQSGENALIIKEWLGHTNLQTTVRYTHLMPKNLMTAAQFLGNMSKK